MDTMLDLNAGEPGSILAGDDFFVVLIVFVNYRYAIILGCLSIRYTYVVYIRQVGLDPHQTITIA